MARRDREMRELRATDLPQQATGLQTHLGKGLNAQVTVNVQFRNEDGSYSSDGLRYGHTFDFKGLDYTEAGELIDDVAESFAAIELASR